MCAFAFRFFGYAGTGRPRRRLRFPGFPGCEKRREKKFMVDGWVSFGGSGSSPSIAAQEHEDDDLPPPQVRSPHQLLAKFPLFSLLLVGQRTRPTYYYYIRPRLKCSVLLHETHHGACAELRTEVGAARCDGGRSPCQGRICGIPADPTRSTPSLQSHLEHAHRGSLPVHEAYIAQPLLHT